MVVHALAVLHPDPRPPTDGEARLAAAAFAAHDGRLGPVAAPWPDLLAARQLAAVAALVPDGPAGNTVWDGVRGAALALGVVTALLLAAVLRRLGCGWPSVALAVVAAGVLPPALGLPGVTAAAVAVPWLLLAAVLCWRSRAPNAVAAVAAVLAVLTAPLVGAALLAAAAYVVVGRPGGSRLVLLAAVLGAAAAGLAVASAGGGPLTGAAPVLPTPAAVVGAACGLLVVAAGWGLRWVRPLLFATVLLLAVLLVPGPGRAAAALLGLVLCAAVAAVVVDDRAPRLPARLRPAASTAALAAGVAAVAVAVPVVLRPPAPAAALTPLLDWGREQESGAVLHAGPLARAELVAAGVPPARLRDLGDPVADGDVVLVADRPGAAAGARCPVGDPLAALPRLGGAPAAVCAARPPAATGAAGDSVAGAAVGSAVGSAADPDGTSRVRVGTALAGNPQLRLDPAAAALLRRGAVDPRVMIVLTALTGAHGLTVVDFPAGPLEPPDAQRRRVLIGAVDDLPATADSPSPLGDWIAAQQPPYAPTVLQSGPDGLLVGYRGTPPAGLLPAS